MSACDDYPSEVPGNPSRYIANRAQLSVTALEECISPYSSTLKEWSLYDLSAGFRDRILNITIYVIF